MVILIRYGELSLKGQLRRKFENTLVSNILRVAKKEGIKGKIKREWGRLYYYTSLPEDFVAKRIAYIFGVVSTSPAFECTSDLEDIAKTAENLSELISKFESFAVKVRRVGTHDYTSMDVARYVGERLKNKTGLKVNLKNPDFKLSIEVREEKAYVYFKVFSGFGGLPVGTQERVIAMDEYSSWFALRRGCDIDVPEKVLESYPQLKALSCYRRIGTVDLSFEDVLKSDYPAVFCSYSMDEILKLVDVLKNRNMPVLTPLASEKIYSKGRVAKLLKSISEMIK